jgi:mycothiol synthase
MSSPYEIVSASVEDLAPAFRLILKHVAESEREARVARALKLISRGELERDGVLVARHETRLLGAIVCVPLRGAGGLLWPPQLVDGADPGSADALVQHGTRWLRGRGAKLAQALLLAEEIELAPPLVRNGFAKITDLIYLRLELDASVTRPDTALRYQTYRQTELELFHDTLLRTYVDSLDCPEVSGVRGLGDIIEGHQAQGGFRPERWWLALAQDRPLGVLLVNEMPEWESWDVAYVGVVPESRGRGLGRELMRKALWEAHAAGVSRITLTVDARNKPALDLYHRLGFEPFEQRGVYLFLYP